MSGHSHWAGIKHRKGINDAKRGQIFTKHGKLISLAAKAGGGNPDSNFQLRLAIERARGENMPKDTIEKAIQRGTGEIKGQAEIQEVIYEAYFPTGINQVAMLIKTATDNKNRTLGEVRTILMKSGGKLVPEGSVSFLFRQVGNINIDVPEGSDPYAIEEKAIDAGAEDTLYAGNILTVYTKPEELQKVKENMEKSGLKIAGMELIYAPLQKTELSQGDRLNYEKLLEELDNQEDVQEIFDNL